MSSVAFACVTLSSDIDICSKCFRLLVTKEEEEEEDETVSNAELNCECQYSFHLAHVTNIVSAHNFNVPFSNPFDSFRPKNDCVVHCTAIPADSFIRSQTLFLN